MNAAFRTFVVGVLVFQWDWPQTPQTIEGRTGRLWSSRMIAVGIDGGLVKTRDMEQALLNTLIQDPEGTLCKVTGVERYATSIQGEGVPIGLLLETHEAA